MSAAKAKPDTFFDLTFRGALPEILRAIATRIEREEVKAERFSAQLTEGAIEVSLRLEVDPK